MKNKEIKAADIWNKQKLTLLGAFITLESQKQTPEQILENKLLGIQYRIEDYINSDTVSEKLRVMDFVQMYLKVFNISKKTLAALFEMKDSNLHKYLTGERKLNTELILKLSSFSHLSPEHWLRIEVRNELIELHQEQQRNKDYQKYDYRKILPLTKFQDHLTAVE